MYCENLSFPFFMSVSDFVYLLVSLYNIEIKKKRSIYTHTIFKPFFGADAGL